MNRFAYSLTFSLLTSAVMFTPEAYAQAPDEQLPPAQIQSEQNLKDIVAQIAAEEDLPIALVEDNPAFVQEQTSDQTIDFSESETTSSTQNAQEESQSVPTEVPTIAEPVSGTETQEIVSEKVEVTTQVEAPATQIVAPVFAPAPAPAPVPAQIEAPVPAPVPATMPVAAPVMIQAPEIHQPAQPQIQEAPAPMPAPAPVTTPQPQAEPQAENSAPASSYSLNEKAPISSKLFGDSGFAPTVMDKRLSISPEHRAKMLMKKKYDEMDLNEDGVVSENEFVTYKTNEAHKIAQEIFTHVDIDKNGIISEEEYGILMKKMIDSYIKSAGKANPQNAAAAPDHGAELNN